MSNLILDDQQGQVIEGDYAVNRAGLVVHGAVHEQNPKATSMYHAHTVYGIAWCSTGRPLDMISQDVVAFYNSHVVVGASSSAVAVDEDSGLSVAKAMGVYRGILHQNHGLLTTSQHSFDDAAFWFIAHERCCKQQMLVEPTGVKPQPLDDKTAAYSREHVGSDCIGWLHFQTLYQHFEATQPDMFF